MAELRRMWAAVTVCVISLIAVAWMMWTAVADGFTVLEVPLVVLELMFLAVVYLLWRALAGADAPEAHGDSAHARPAAVPPHRQPRERTAAVGERGFTSWMSTLADRWFRGLRDRRRR